jgi:biopolymer transport protein TolR
MTLPGSRRAEINMTPLIDVLLVLLIIFMVITPTQSKGLKVQIPAPDGTPAPVEPQPALVLTVDKDRNYQLNSRAIAGTELPARLRSLLALRADKTLFIQGATELEFKDVAMAIDIAAGAGFQRFGLLTSKQLR